MKRFSAVAILILLFLASCKSGPLKDIRLDKTFGLYGPNDVLIHSAPSLNAETFYIEKPDTFIVEDVVCADGLKTLDCYADLVLSKDEPELAKVAFYKVNFSSGKTGYINALYFYPEPGDGLISERTAKRMGTTPRGYVDLAIRSYAEIDRKWDEKERKEKELIEQVERDRLNTIAAAPWQENEKERVIKHEVWIGMSGDQLMLSQNPPARIDKSVTAEGETEQWHYAKRLYTVTNGTVTRWKETVENTNEYLRNKPRDK